MGKATQIYKMKLSVGAMPKKNYFCIKTMVYSLWPMA